MKKRSVAAVLVSLALVSGCGGGGDDKSTSGSDSERSTTTTGSLDAGSGSSPFTPPEVEYVEADARVRFVNVFSDSGQDSDIEFLWGGFGGSESAAELGYGEVSDWMTAKVREDTGSDEPEGEVDLQVSARRAGAAGDELPLMTDDELVPDGQELVWILSSTEDVMNPGSTAVGSRWIFVDGGTNDVPAPPAGKASLFLIDNGLGHLPDSFVTIGEPGSCLTFENEGGGGNAANPYYVDPGSIEVGIYDANGGCAEPTGELVPIEAKAGHRYLVVAMGHTKQTRTAVVIDLDE